MNSKLSITPSLVSSYTQVGHTQEAKQRILTRAPTLSGSENHPTKYGASWTLNTGKWEALETVSDFLVLCGLPWAKALGGALWNS